MPCANSLPPWTANLAWTDLPVLRATADAIRQLARHPDDADAHLIAEIALRDPLLCLRILASAATRQSDCGTPVDSVTAALVLIGIDPFFRDCASLPVLDCGLGPARGAAALAVVGRSLAAARVAAAFAIHRQDEHAEAVHLAALLHDFPSVLACYFGPPGHPAPAATADVLLRRWGLPDTLRTLAVAATGDAAGPRMVALGVRIALHAQRAGWHAPELAADFADAALLLNLQPRAAAALARNAAG